MKIELIAINLLVSVIVGFSGCNKETASTDASLLDTKEEAADSAVVQIQKNIDRISDWRSYIETNSKYHNFTSQLCVEINQVSDPSLRIKCFDSLVKVAFSFPLDASDPDTRSEQLSVFFELSNAVAHCAYWRYDIDNFWDVNLRRLKRIKSEMQGIEAFLSGRGDTDKFSGNPDGWHDYSKRVKARYDNCDRSYSRYFGTTVMADFLTYERWHSIHSQLEEMLGHKVKVWPCVLEKWEKERQKREATGKAKEVK